MIRQQRMSVRCKRVCLVAHDFPPKSPRRSNREFLVPDRRAELGSSTAANRPRRTPHSQRYLVRSGLLDHAKGRLTRCKPEAQVFPDGIIQSQCVSPESCLAICDNFYGLFLLAVSPRFAPSQKSPNRLVRLLRALCRTGVQTWSPTAPARHTASGRDLSKFALTKLTQWRSQAAPKMATKR